MDTPDWERIKTILHFFLKKKKIKPFCLLLFKFWGIFICSTFKGEKKEEAKRERAREPEIFQSGRISDDEV